MTYQDVKNKKCSIIKHLSGLTRNSILTFVPPPHNKQWIPFENGPWLRLFTDGGQSDPDSDMGLATCGYVIIMGPFNEHNPAKITDRDGTIIYEGRAFIGIGNTYTNNDAEYAGLFVGLIKCWEIGANQIHHLTDSTLVSNIESGKSTTKTFH